MLTLQPILGVGRLATCRLKPAVETEIGSLLRLYMPSFAPAVDAESLQCTDSDPLHRKQCLGDAIRIASKDRQLLTSTP